MALKKMSKLDFRMKINFFELKWLSIFLIVNMFLIWGYLSFQENFFEKYPKYCFMSKCVTLKSLKMPSECKGKIPNHFLFVPYVELDVGGVFIQDSIYNDYYYDLLLMNEIYLKTLQKNRIFTVDNADRIHLNDVTLFKWYSDFFQVFSPDTVKSSAKLFLYCTEDLPCFFSYNLGVVDSSDNSTRLRELNFFVEKLDSLYGFFQCISR